MSLQEAIAADDVNELYSLIEQDENLLDRGSEGPFPNTPLHNAAEQGKTKVATEIAILKPMFARKLNRGGYSPMHLALQKKHYRTVRVLMTLDPELIRGRGRGGITPLHFVAREKGDNGWDNVELLELLAEFLSACKSSIEDLTNQCKTAVYVAIRTGNNEAFKVLFGWLKQVHLTRILDWKDQDGNTVLHVAASEKQPEIIKLLIGYTAVTAMNFQGKMALEIFEANHIDNQDLARKLRREGRRARPSTPTISLSQFLSRELTAFEKCVGFFRVKDESTRNIILIVSTLIAAATYQATLTPPGYWQFSSSDATTDSDNMAHQAGSIIRSDWGFRMYVMSNSSAFFASIAAIWAAISTVEDNPWFHFAITPICAAYITCLLVQFSNGPGVSGLAIWSAICVVALFAICLISWLVFPLRWRIEYTRVRR